MEQPTQVLALKNFSLKVGSWKQVLETLIAALYLFEDGMHRRRNTSFASIPRNVQVNWLYCTLE